ncbi:hypothetical protein [Nocardioides aurantiacus]|uniref:hypothetical protein n=1 Tax=Nocardioides aurantiacus TaxID=86796 RepID=UPI00403F6B33
MAWEWVAPVVTGAVGIAGVTGTVLNGRFSRDSAAALAHEQRVHALQERTHAEKRLAYAGFLEAVQGARWALVQIRALPKTPENITELATLRTNALAEVSLRRSHLRLTGPPRVRKVANDTHWHFAAVLLAAIRDEPNEISPKYEDTLLAAMKVDLGYELAQKDVEALNRIPPD